MFSCQVTISPNTSSSLPHCHIPDQQFYFRNSFVLLPLLKKKKKNKTHNSHSFKNVSSCYMQ